MNKKVIVALVLAMVFATLVLVWGWLWGIGAFFLILLFAGFMYAVIYAAIYSWEVGISLAVYGPLSTALGHYALCFVLWWIGLTLPLWATIIGLVYGLMFRSDENWRSTLKAKLSKTLRPA